MKNEIIMFKNQGIDNNVTGAMLINDYSDIVAPDWNRNYTPAGLKDLRKSISNHGNLTGISVVKHKNKWITVDGNHRVKVLREQNKSCVANIVDLKNTNLTENELMILLNILPKNWKPADYLNNGVVYHNNKDYLFLRDIHEETKIGIVALYSMYSFGETKAKESFELGEWKITTKHLGNRVVQYAQELNELIPFSMNVNFLKGFAVCVNKKGYNQAQMMKQAKKFGNHVHDNDKPNQHRAMLNKVYNHCVLQEEELYLDK